MIAISATEAWRTTHPGATVGLLEISGVDNTRTSAELNARKRETEARLRQRYGGFVRHDFMSLPVIEAYARYYRRFNKTYHVLLQLESIVLKGKDLPDVSPLVDADFVAEVDTLVLTAGHDVAVLREPVSIDASIEGDVMTLMNGTRKAIYADDMIMRDTDGISCSVIYGQDDRSLISSATSHALYVAYAPAGVPPDAVDAQLRGIEENVRLFSPAATVEQCRLVAATRCG